MAPRSMEAITGNNGVINVLSQALQMTSVERATHKSLMKDVGDRTECKIRSRLLSDGSDVLAFDAGTSNDQLHAKTLSY